MAINGASSHEEILDRLNQLFIDANCRIRRTHQLMDRVRRHIGNDRVVSDLSQEDGWRFAL